MGLEGIFRGGKERDFLCQVNNIGLYLHTIVQLTPEGLGTASPRLGAAISSLQRKLVTSQELQWMK